MAQHKQLDNITVRNAQLIFKNFAGKETPMNAEGQRNFGVLIDDDTAETLEKDGWNVKRLKVREEGDTPQAWLPVALKYQGRNGKAVRPPEVVLITSRGRTNLPEDFVDVIDQSDIEKVDLIVRPYEWVMNGGTGIKAYLKSIYVTIAEDELALEYRDVPEIGQADQPLAIEAGNDPSIVDAEWEDVGNE